MAAARVPNREGVCRLVIISENGRVGKIKIFDDVLSVFPVPNCTETSTNLNKTTKSTRPSGQLDLFGDCK